MRDIQVPAPASFWPGEAHGIAAWQHPGSLALWAFHLSPVAFTVAGAIVSVGAVDSVSAARFSSYNRYIRAYIGKVYVLQDLVVCWHFTFAERELFSLDDAHRVLGPGTGTGAKATVLIGANDSVSVSRFSSYNRCIYAYIRKVYVLQDLDVCWHHTFADRERLGFDDARRVLRPGTGTGAEAAIGIVAGHGVGFVRAIFHNRAVSALAGVDVLQDLIHGGNYAIADQERFGLDDAYRVL